MVREDFTPQVHPFQTDDLESDSTKDVGLPHDVGPIPNLFVTVDLFLSQAVFELVADLQGRRRRDSITSTFQDDKISVLEFDDSIHGFRTSYGIMGCFSWKRSLRLLTGNLKCH
ncbi:hypothetical protein F0562_031336 [Nyssa sinensis]|uniref:Uncharacterized protein n=1 Tax=Nyssa sinensis TaxID=561372 RepID=A0A5J5ATV6_9ASTE|nr:hypothetical protein F0562_031336 [Nyssa sinensis]